MKDNNKIIGYFTTTDASIYLGISRSTFLRHIRKQIPEFKITDHIFAYAKSDLDSYVASRDAPKGRQAQNQEVRQPQVVMALKAGHSKAAA